MTLRDLFDALDAAVEDAKQTRAAAAGEAERAAREVAAATEAYEATVSAANGRAAAAAEAHEAARLRARDLQEQLRDRTSSEIDGSDRARVSS